MIIFYFIFFAVTAINSIVCVILQREEARARERESDADREKEILRSVVKRKEAPNRTEGKQNEAGFKPTSLDKPVFL